jgi:hypothetical protein
MLGIEDEPYRFDVVTVVLSQLEDEARCPEIELLKNFWREDQLRKRTYSSHYYD